MVIFFDIDDTLIDSRSAHKIALNEICNEYSFQIEANSIFAEWRFISDKYLKLYFQNKLTINEQRILRIKELWKFIGKQISDEQASLVHKKYHAIFLQHCISFPDTLPTLKKLKKNRLGIITNGAISDQTEKLKKNGLDHFFDPTIISEKAGLWKPQKEIFELAAQQANQPVTNCIFVGDSYELDYCGSINAGMKGIWIDRSKNNINSTTENVEKITSLEELVKHNYLNIH